MSIECGYCERDARSGHDEDCPRFDLRMADCTCDPEWWHGCPVHALSRETPPDGTGRVVPVSDGES